MKQRFSAVVLAVMALAASQAAASAPASVRPVGRLAPAFEQNVGQFDPQVLFRAKAEGYGVSLGGRESVLTLGRDGRARVRMTLAGAEPSGVRGEAERKGRVFYVSDPARPTAGAARFDRVRYAGAWPGTDVVFHGTDGRQVRFDFELAPGADPDRIRLAFDGADQLTVEPDGDLALAVGGESLRVQRPVVFQETPGGRRSVEGRFVADGPRAVRFALAEYDRALPLVIDPTIDFTSYLGTGADEEVLWTETRGGSVYVSGRTWNSAAFPTVPSNPATLDPDPPHCFVSKFTPDGSDLAWSVVFNWSGTLAHECGPFALGPSATVHAAFRQALSGGQWGVSVFSEPDSAAGYAASNFAVPELQPDQPVRIQADNDGNTYLLGSCNPATYRAGEIVLPNGERTVAYLTDCGSSSRFGNPPRFESLLLKIDPAGRPALRHVRRRDAAREPATSIASPTPARALAVDPVTQVAWVGGSARSADLAGNPDRAIIDSSLHPALHTSCGEASPGACMPNAFVLRYDTTAAGAASLTYASYYGIRFGSDGLTPIPWDGTLADWFSVEDMALEPGGAINLFGNIRRVRQANQPYDLFVARLDPWSPSDVFDPLWVEKPFEKVIAGSLSDTAVRIARRPNGDLVLGGFTASPDFPLGRPGLVSRLHGTPWRRSCRCCGPRRVRSCSRARSPVSPRCGLPNPRIRRARGWRSPSRTTTSSTPRGRRRWTASRRRLRRRAVPERPRRRQGRRRREALLQRVRVPHRPHRTRQQPADVHVGLDAGQRAALGPHGRLRFTRGDGGGPRRRPPERDLGASLRPAGRHGRLRGHALRKRPLPTRDQHRAGDRRRRTWRNSHGHDRGRSPRQHARGHGRARLAGQRDEPAGRRGRRHRHRRRAARRATRSSRVRNDVDPRCRRPDRQLGSPPYYYDVRTTATFATPPTVCIDIRGHGFADSGVALYRHAGGAWAALPSTVVETTPGFTQICAPVALGVTPTTLAILTPEVPANRIRTLGRDDVVGPGHGPVPRAPGPTRTTEGRRRVSRLYRPEGAVYDPARNALYFAEKCGFRVRRLDLATGAIRTMTGTGLSEPGRQPAGRARRRRPGRGQHRPALSRRSCRRNGVALDPAGNLYIADSGHCRIRKLSPRRGRESHDRSSPWPAPASAALPATAGRRRRLSSAATSTSGRTPAARSTSPTVTACGGLARVRPPATARSTAPPTKSSRPMPEAAPVVPGASPAPATSLALGPDPRPRPLGGRRPVRRPALAASSRSSRAARRHSCASPGLPAAPSATRSRSLRTAISPGAPPNAPASPTGSASAA